MAPAARVSLLLSLVAVAGCAPPYIVELDRAAPLARQMTVVGTVGPIGLQSGLPSVRFLPVKPTASSVGALDVQSGFVVTSDSVTEQLYFAYSNSNGSAQTAFGRQFPLAGQSPNYPLNQYEVTTTTTTANILVFTFVPSTPANSSVTLLEAALPSGPLGLPPGVATNPQVLNGINGSELILGVQVMPAATTPDTFNWLLSTGVQFTQGSASLSAGSSVFVTGANVPINSLLTLPAPIESRFLYYTDQTGSVSYASYFTGSQWVCYQWTTAAPVTLGGITHRIDALLSTGDLLSTEGGKLRLYDPTGTGTQLYAVPLNGLQFCYEAYLGSTPYVFFSLPMSLQHGDWAFNVYAIPSSSMRGLGG
jgi:hypothetical protein